MRVGQIGSGYAGHALDDEYCGQAYRFKNNGDITE